MGRNRKTYEEKTKRDVAIEAIRERKTVQEIATEYGVSPSMVTKWKQEFLNGGVGASKREKELEKKLAQAEKEKDEACLQLGKTQMMVELIKKKLNLED